MKSRHVIWKERPMVSVLILKRPDWSFLMEGTLSMVLPISTQEE